MNKKRRKVLATLALRLPLSYEIVKVGEFMTGNDLIVSDVQNKPQKIVPNQIYKSTGQKLHKIDHLQKLKRAWTYNKTQGIMNYIIWLDLNNKRVATVIKDSRNIKQVDQSLVKIASGKASSFWRQLVIFLTSFLAVFSNNKTTT